MLMDVVVQYGVDMLDVLYQIVLDIGYGSVHNAWGIYTKGDQDLC